MAARWHMAKNIRPALTELCDRRLEMPGDIGNLHHRNPKFFPAKGYPLFLLLFLHLFRGSYVTTWHLTVRKAKVSWLLWAEGVGRKPRWWDEIYHIEYR